MLLRFLRVLLAGNRSRRQSHPGTLWQNRAVATTARRGPGRPPAAKSAETRARILRTAREVFAELGYDAATFQEIAQRADLTRPAINHYFPSKGLLYQEVVRQTRQVLADGMAEARGRHGPAARIRSFLGATVWNCGDDRSVAAFLVTSVLESQRRPDLDAPDILADVRGFVTEVLGEAVAAGDARPHLDVPAAAEALVAMLWGLGLWAGFAADRDRLDAVADEFLRLLAGDPFLRTA
jgi:AcrR family transcriptional regulator